MAGRSRAKLGAHGPDVRGDGRRLEALTGRIVDRHGLDGAGGAKERGEREVGPRARRPEPAQGQDEQHQAGAVAHGA